MNEKVAEYICMHYKLVNCFISFVRVIGILSAVKEDPNQIMSVDVSFN